MVDTDTDDSPNMDPLMVELHYHERGYVDTMPVEDEVE